LSAGLTNVEAKKTMSPNADLAIIGGGPGGYVAALRGAQLGARVVLIEQEHLGGVCLNWGCIPIKALLRSAEVLALVKEASTFGVLTDGTRLDWPTARARQQEVVVRIVGGVEKLLSKAGVTVVRGTGRFVSRNTVEVTEAGQVTERITAQSIVVATGSRPIDLPIQGLEGPCVLSSKTALGLDELPQSMMIIGGGAVGVEFATLFSLCGVQVTLVEMLPSLVPTLDHDIGEALAWVLTEQGVAVYTDARITQCRTGDAGCQVTIATVGEERQVEVERVLVAVGRRPNVEGVGLESVGLNHGKKGIKVNEAMFTNVPGVYAVGDVTGGIMLAHVASHQGIVAAEGALGHPAKVCYDAVPKCIFSHPEAASVGLSEAEACQRGFDVRVGKFSLSNNGMAIARGEDTGFVKIVAEAQLGQVLGLHIVAPRASDLILEGTMALNLEATLDEFIVTIHPHPTLSEAIAEAALAAEKRALHALS
jgi:dihydrolipoamide dehydrogenase